MIAFTSGLASFIAWLLSSLAPSFLGRVFDALDKSTNAAIEARRIDANLSATKDTNHTSKQIAFRQADSVDLKTKTRHRIYWILATPFIVCLMVFFAALTAYNLLWCADCIYPQTWTIAGYPEPYDAWAGAMIAWLFGIATLKISRGP